MNKEKKQKERITEAIASFDNMILPKAGSAIYIKVTKHKKVLGKFMAGRGGITWVPKSKSYGTKLSWEKFAKIIEAMEV